MPVSPPFLGRTQEQAQFRQVLATHKPAWTRKQLPTFTKLATQFTGRGQAALVTPEQTQPYIFLLYGEGGMGKTTLTKKLYEILQGDFKPDFQALFLDWESEQKLNRALQVGHDHIQPETILEVLYKAFVKQGWGSYFNDYPKAKEHLQAVEAKVNKAIQGPENPLLNEVAQLGAQGIALIIRQATPLNPKPEDIANIATGIKVSAEGLSQARRLIEKQLAPQEYELYLQPDERLAEALAQGIVKLTAQKPLVIFLDTYEIVDRPACDYTLRHVLQHSGAQSIWVISGRSNLADSNARFKGYKRDFAENRLYAKALSEFSLDEVQNFFAAYVPEQPLNDTDADAVAQFSLGIPFVVNQAMEMYRQGKPISEIVEPVKAEFGKTKLRDQVINATCERFLVHCFNAKTHTEDRQVIYALSLLRRPEPDLLRAMLNLDDLQTRLQTLHERYSFVLVDDCRLDEKLATFLRDYLLNNPVMRTEPYVRQLQEEAIAWLTLEIEALSAGLSDPADRFADERIAALMLDLVHHQLWLKGDRAEQAWIPQLVEGWQYAKGWARNLLEVIDSFRLLLSSEQQQWLTQLSEEIYLRNEADTTAALLKSLTKLAQQQSWPPEQTLILQLQTGKLLSRQDRHTNALQVYLDLAPKLPPTAQTLKQALADALYYLSSSLIWPNKARSAKYSAEAETAIVKAIELYPDANRGYYYNQAVLLDDSKCYEEAISSYHQVIQLDPNYAYPHHGLGNVYASLKRYEEAIASYHQAIQLDPNYASPHNGLGNVYDSLKRYEEAIASYHQAIQLDPNDAYPYNNLGWLYLLTDQLSQAQATFEKTIELHPAESLLPLLNLGLVHSLQNNLDSAHHCWRQGLELVKDDDDWDNAVRALYQFALGDTDPGIQAMQTVIAAGASVGVIQNALDDAEVLARCPQPPERIEVMIALLREGLAALR